MACSPPPRRGRWCRALLFPAIHAEIDWTQGVQFLDKEFQQIVREAKTTRRYADKLVGVT